MKKIRQSAIRRTLLGLSFTFVLFASVSSEVGEWYARNLYPCISKILSGIASWVPFSLDEWVVISLAFLVLCYPFYARKHARKRWLSVIVGELEILLWIYVWFYWGWGMNYYRDSFFQRAEVKPVQYDESRFKDFLAEYTDSLERTFKNCIQNDSLLMETLFHPIQPFTGKRKEAETPVSLWKVANVSGEGDSSAALSVKRIQDIIKETYGKVPEKYGLTIPESYQHPKRSSFNSLYSNVGVLGFMGPFFAESHVNHELSKLEYPFTYAHELSHLLGISSEAEANLWAYTVCSQSTEAFIRFSGYFGLFTYVWSNARYLLSASDFDKWEASVAPEIMAAFYHTHAYWSMRYNHTLGELQSALYTFYLKRNRISSGQKNYAQVVGLLLSLPDFKIQLEGK